MQRLRRYLGQFKGKGNRSYLIFKKEWFSFKFKKIPERFESNSYNYSGIIGASEALRFINSIGINNILEYEKNLSNFIPLF